MRKEYQIIENTGHDINFIEKFHEYVSTIFPSISFKEWHKKGFWDENYKSFSINEADRIISNACISQLQIILNGKIFKGIQIGAVGTLPDYRNKGLSRKILEYILNKYNKDTDLFFLYANDSVLDYYPKFGFTSQTEYKFVKNVAKNSHNYKAVKLDLNYEKDFKLILEILNNRKSISKIFGAKNYQYITMWHLLNIYKNDIYYLSDVDSIFVMKENNSSLDIFEIFSKNNFNLDNVLPRIISSNKIAEVRFYFPPDQFVYSFDEIIKDDTGLFIKGTMNFDNKHFRFPITAIT